MRPYHEAIEESEGNMREKKAQKILIVDDQYDNLLVIKAILRNLSDVELITVGDANEALGKFQEHDFALAVLDVQMPGMDGYELAVEMRKCINGHETPIIFLSAIHTNDFHIAKGYSVGAVDFLSKPLNNDIFLSKIKVFLELDSYKRRLSEMVEEKTAEINNKQHACEVAQSEKIDIFNAIDDMLVVIDQNHTILQANRATLEHFDERIVGKKCFEVFAGIEKPLGTTAELLALSQNTPIHFKEPLNSPNGMLLDVSIFPIRSTLNDSPQFLHVFRNVTETRKLEEELRQSEKMRALGTLAGGVAHDFNNQLTGIMGYATLLRKKITGEDPAITKYIDTILKSARISAELTKQLLAFSRKDDAKFALFDVHDQINDIINLVTRTFNKSISIEIAKEATASIINGDASQLNNALLNLCVNARDAMPHGGVISLSTRNISIVDEQIIGQDGHLAPGEYIEIKLSDTGSGMDNETLMRIFEPFFSTKPKGEGTGLGLPSVYSTLNNHNGSISVTSQIGEGTTFVILLPIARSSKSENALKGTSTLYMGQGGVLLVDDNDWVRNSALQILEDLGYRVTGYGKSETALNYYRDNWQEIDLVMLDLVMPDMEVAEIIENISKINPDARILLVTGGNEDNFKKVANAKNDIRLLRKPYEVSVLSKIIQEMKSGH